MKTRQIVCTIGLATLLLLIYIFTVCTDCILDYDTLQILPESAPSLTKQLQTYSGFLRSESPSPSPSPSNSLPFSSPQPGQFVAEPPLLSNSGTKSKNCDIYSGNWIFDSTYPLYQSSTCPFMEGGFRCQENGRPDTDYLKWRWEPLNCILPRFNATNMLHILKNKRVVFSGDSIGRNQWQSLLCMLYASVSNKEKVYEARGQQINRVSGVFKFEEYNLTIEYYVSHFLVLETRKPPHAPRKARGAIRLDQMTSSSKKWLGADILIFNSGHWWSHKDVQEGTTIFQEGNNVYPGMNLDTAYAKAMNTWAKWIDTHLDLTKIKIFFRGTAPVHFMGATWNKGGRCDLETHPDLNESHFHSYSDNKMMALEDAISKMKIPPIILNVSKLSDMRKDAHISIWKMNGSVQSMSSRLKHQDCSHWCLPGLPDTWNEILYYHLINQADT